jgi:hypothetical protein
MAKSTSVLPLGFMADILSRMSKLIGSHGEGPGWMAKKDDRTVPSI